MPSYCPRCLQPANSSDGPCPSCGHPPGRAGQPVDPRLGTTVAGGQYRVIRRLGRGGFGTVYLVETVVGGLRRAMKVLHAELAPDASLRERVVREAQALERVNHPNVTRCFAAGLLDDHVTPWLLLELVEGVSLATLLVDEVGQPKGLTPLRTVRLLKQIASGLVAVHASGSLHRDLKPQNILIARAGTRDELVKIVDFGLARLVEPLASAEGPAGTPPYMAPEQRAIGGRLDERTDLWQLGAVAHAMLTGAPPSRVNGAAVVAAELVRAVEPWPDLARLLGRLLADDPDERPTTAALVCADLARIEHAMTSEPASSALAVLDTLCATPGPAAWRTLCQYLSASEDPVGFVHDADARLTGWPDEIRVAPMTWWEAVRRGQPLPVWPLVRTLDLRHQGLTDEDVVLLAASPAMGAITQLRLSGNDLSDRAVETLVRSPHLARVRVLDLGENRLTSVGLEALAAGGVLARLTRLDVSDNGVGPEGVFALAAQAHALAELRLSGNGVGPQGAAAFREAGAFRNLRVLEIADADLGPEGVAALTSANALPLLTTLDIAGNAAGAAGMAAVAQSGLAARLQVLDVSRNRLGASGVARLLASASGLQRLRELRASDNDLDPAAVLALSAAPCARRLRLLDLSGNPLGDAGLAALLGAQQLAALRDLRVRSAGVTAAAMSLVASAPVELAVLDLSGNALGDAGLVALAESLQRLHVARLDLADVDATWTGVGHLLSAVPSLEVVDLSGNDLSAYDGATIRAGRLVSLSIARTRLRPADAARVLSEVGGPALREVSLDALHLGDQGCADVVGALQAAASLQRLSLADNRLGPPAAAALAASVLPHRLGALDLSYNELGDDGAARLVSGTWHVLQDLRLEHADLTAAGVATVAATPVLPSLLHLDLRRNLVTNPVDLHALAPRTIATLERTFALLAAEGADFAARFYGLLFERYPAFVPLFRHVSMRRQHQHLMAMLTTVVEHLRHPDALASTLGTLAMRHVGYGATGAQYHAVIGVLLDVMRERLGPGWTTDVEAAWHDGLDAVAHAMVSGHRAATTAAADAHLESTVA